MENISKLNYTTYSALINNIDLFKEKSVKSEYSFLNILPFSLLKAVLTLFFFLYNHHQVNFLLVLILLPLHLQMSLIVH